MSFNLSRVESEVFDKMTAFILLLKRTSEILGISLSLISGETFTTIGIFEFSFVFSLLIIFNKLFQSP